MSFFLSLVIFLSPLAPLSDIPPTSIWLGKGIPIIQGEKLKPVMRSRRSKWPCQFMTL